MTTYTLFIPCRYAALYYAWELGNKPAAIAKAINRLPRDARGWVDMSAETFMRPVMAKRWTKTRLEGFAARIREAISYQEGKLKKPLTAGGGCIYVKSND